MTKQDYIAIAKAIKACHENKKFSAKSQCDKLTLQSMAVEIAKVMHQENPKFQFGKFLNACGFEV